MKPSPRRSRPVTKWWRYAALLLRDFRRNTRIDFAPFRALGRGYDRPAAKADAKAGFDVALLGFPQSIAYSLIAGLPPQAGLFSASFGAIIGPLFTKSRFIVLGPTNATAVLIFSSLLALGLTEDQRLAVLPLFLALVGLFLIVGAIAKLSVVINYISRTVVTGYITAAAALIVVNQLQNALGFRVPDATSFLGIVGGTVRALPHTRWEELLLSLATLACYLVVARSFPRLPNVVVTLAVVSLLAWGLSRIGYEFAYVQGFRLTEFRLHGIGFDVDLVAQLAGPAMAVAFLSILEGSSVGQSLASRSGERIDVNQEMYAMGMANLGVAFVGGMNASGSLTRSALAWSSGARTPLASVFSGLIVLGLAIGLGPLLGYIPRSALAVVVMCIAVSLFNPHTIRVAFRTTRSDAAVFLVTCLGALLFPLDQAILLGAFTSVVLFLRKAGVPEMTEVSFTDTGQLATRPAAAASETPGISILHVEGDLFFGSTEIFLQQIRQVTRDPNLRIIVLRLKNAHHLDASCVLAIEDLLKFLRANQRHLLVSGAHPEVFRVFRNSGLLDLLGRENFFPAVPGNPTLSTRHALKRAQQLLGQKSAAIRLFVDATKQARSAEEKS